MTTAADWFIRYTQMSRARALLVSSALFVAIAWLDSIVPQGLSVHSLFLLPIILLAWNAGAFWSGLFVMASGVVVAMIGLLFGHHHTSTSLLLLNTALRAIVYFLVAMAIAKLIRRIYDQECQLSRTDFLTGLPNRFAFYDVVEWELERQRRYGRPLSVIYLDCDNFKQVNDELGHSEGDFLLKTVATQLTAGMRGTDLAARLGGDEYAVLLPETGGEAALRVAESLREDLNRAMRAHGWGVTFSFGVVGFNAPPRSVDKLIEIADRLMYRAKQSGKDRIAFDEFSESARDFKAG